MTAIADEELLGELRELVKRYRHQCLWYTREDAVPTDADGAFRVLSAIEDHGDRAGFTEARRLKQWLSQHYSVRSADS